MARCFLFGMTRDDGRRLALAIAVSIALHEILAGLVPAKFADTSPPVREIVTHARIVRIAVRPTIAPVSRRRLPRDIPHPRVIAPAQPRPIARATGARSRARVATRLAAAARPKPPRLSHAKPVWDIATSGGHGATLAQTGNAAGAGSGPADAGSGDGAMAANQPCGYVTFSDPHGSQFDPRTRGFWVDVRMSVHFADGSSQSMILDYPWYYPSEAANPWSQANLNDPNFLPRFQSPPADKIAGEPPLVQYVMQHSTTDGLTLLKDCPSPTPTS
jgi:hypothetical protein